MRNVILEDVTDWSTLQPGEAVRATCGNTQIDTLVANATAWEVLAEGVVLQRSAGWVIQRPREVPPLPTEIGSVIRASMLWPSGVAEECVYVRGDGVWLDQREVDQTAFVIESERISDAVVDWSWVSKPAELAVPDAARKILGRVLGILDDTFSGELVFRAGDEDPFQKVRRLITSTIKDIGGLR